MRALPTLLPLVVSAVTITGCVFSASEGTPPDGNVGTTNQPLVLTSPFNVVGTRVGAGFASSCALEPGGTVACWGKNTNGEIGIGTTTAYEPWARRTLVTSATALAVGGAHACAARTSDGTVQCWGANGYGQGADSCSSLSCPTPLTVSSLTQVSSLAVGDYTSFAIQPSGIRAWGWGYHNGLGNEVYAGNILVRTPISVEGLSGYTIVEASGGSQQGCALTSVGTVLCWGNTPYLDSSVPAGYSIYPASTHVATLPSPAISVGVAANHFCAVVQGGQVYCWGVSTNGQGGSLGFLPGPTLVPNVSNAVQVTLGSTHTCARLSNGTAKCWGADANGQLGYGTTAGWLPPVSVAGPSGVLNGITHIAAGAFHTCAIASTLAYCWGSNAHGELGNGTTTDASSPVRVQYAQQKTL